MLIFHPFSRPARVLFYFSRSPVVLIICLILSLALTGCGDKNSNHAAARPAAPVTTAKAIAKDTPVTLKAVGNVKASNSVTVKSRVDGHILRIHFLDGDTVTAGQLLYTIDPETYIYTQKGAQANVAGDRATAELAKKDYVRYKDLYEQNVISRDEYEQKLTAYETARKAMEADAAQESIAKRNVHFTRITSPIDGIAGSTLLDEGNLVAADKDNLVVIKTITPVDVQFSIPGRQLSRVRDVFVDDQLTVLATPASSGSEPTKGVLTFLDNWVNPGTGMINLKARFPNQDKTLWPGQFVVVDLILSMEPDAVRIPGQAVQRGPDGKYVYVVENGKARMQPVTLGMRVDDEIVVATGIKEGDTVVIEGMLRLYPGAPVTVKPPKEEAASTAPNAAPPSQPVKQPVTQPAAAATQENS
jgi:RND family efflux transporter, MFP subunit